jgi:hypothetical protein
VVYVNGTTIDLVVDYSIPVGSTGDVTLIANWKQDTYTVIYSPGTHGTWVVTDQTIVDLIYGAPMPPFTGDVTVDHEPGWTFTGWDKEIATTVVESVTYVAQWTQNKYTITYAPGPYGTWKAVDETTTGLFYGDKTPAFKGDTALAHVPGWVFAGWSPLVTSTVTGDVVYTAQWKIELKYYSVTYDGNGYTGEGIPADVHGPHISGSIVIVQRPGDSMTMEGYVFLGWATHSEATEATHAVGSTFTIFKNTVLYAVWQKTLTYSVTYRPGLHGFFTDFAGETEIVYHIASGEATPTAPTMTSNMGWTFTGWNPTLTTTVTKDIIYEAQWNQNTYTITYTPGTHGTFTTQVYTNLVYGTTTPTFIGTPSGILGYTFAGWTPTVTNTVTDNVVYTAQWTLNDNTNSGGGGGGTQTKPPTTTPKPPTTIPNPPPTTPPPPPPTPSTPDSNNNDDGDEVLPVWALVNLVLSIAGLILAIIATSYILLQHYKQKKQPTGQKNIKNKYVTDQGDDKEAVIQKQKQHRNLWLITTLALGIVGIIVFLLTEDMSRKMVLVDLWTIVNAIIFIAEIIAIALIFKHKHNKNNDDDNKEEKRKQIK